MVWRAEQVVLEVEESKGQGKDKLGREAVARGPLRTPVSRGVCFVAREPAEFATFPKS